MTEPWMVAAMYGAVIVACLVAITRKGREGR